MPRFRRLFCCLSSNSATSVATQGSAKSEPKEDPRSSPSHLEICEACRIEAKYQKRKSFFKFWRKKRAADISYVCPGLAQVQQEIEEQQRLKSASDRHVKDSARSPVPSVSGSPQNHRTGSAHSHQSGSPQDSHLPGSTHRGSPPDSHLPGSPHRGSPQDSHLPGSPHRGSPQDSHLPGSPHIGSPPDSHLSGSSHRGSPQDSHLLGSPPRGSPPDSHLSGSSHRGSPQDSHLPGSPHRGSPPDSHLSGSSHRGSPQDSHLPGSPRRQKSESAAQSLHSHRSESRAQSPLSHKSASLNNSFESQTAQQQQAAANQNSTAGKQTEASFPNPVESQTGQQQQDAANQNSTAENQTEGPNVQKFVEDIDARNRAEIAELQVKFKKKKTPIYRQVSQGVQTLMLLGSGSKSKTESEKASVPNAIQSQAAEQPQAENQTEASLPNPVESETGQQQQAAANQNSTAEQQIEGEAPVETERDDEWQTVKEDNMVKLTSLGFTEDQATQAMVAVGNNVERAAEWLFSGSSVDSPRKTPVVEACASLSKSKPLDHIPESIQEIYNEKKIPPITREEYNQGIAEAILETEPVTATSLSTVASSSHIYPNMTEQVNSVGAFFSDDDNDEEEKVIYSFSASDRKRGTKTAAEADSHSVIQSVASTDRSVDRRRGDTVRDRNATDEAGWTGQNSDDDKGAGCKIM